MAQSIGEIYQDRVAAGKLAADPAQRAVLPELERIRDVLSNPAKRGWWFTRSAGVPKGLYIWGGVGGGKSMLMDLFVAALEVPVRRVHFHAFMQEIQSALHQARQSQAEDAIQPVAEEVARGLKVLALDEMQINDIADAMIVGRLFEALFKAGIVVVTTSNRPPEDLYKEGLNRALFLPFIALLQERMVVHQLTGTTDYRQNMLAGNPVYFTPLSPETREAIEALWQDLTDGQAAPLQLQVKGRRVEIPAFHNGVARARFGDLCGKPLGPADYLALAKVTRVLVLEDIPRLSRDNFNEAKRFVTLIDTLYEARVRLICSAATAPEKLYIEGDGSFEFARTVSRLHEMQSDTWGE